MFKTVFIMVMVKLFIFSNVASAQNNMEICSCTGRGGVAGVTLWGPKGEPCGGMKEGNILPWGTYSSSCRIPDWIGKCAGEGGVEGLELWGPVGEICGGLWENKDRYTADKRKTQHINLCSCKGLGGVNGVTLWGPESDYCAGIPDDKWGKYDSNCKR